MNIKYITFFNQAKRKYYDDTRDVTHKSSENSSLSEENPKHGFEYCKKFEQL